MAAVKADLKPKAEKPKSVKSKALVKTEKVKTPAPETESKASMDLGGANPPGPENDKKPDPELPTGAQSLKKFDKFKTK